MTEKIEPEPGMSEAEGGKVDRFPRFCGPAALACALSLENDGEGRQAAAKMIRQYEPTATGPCCISSIAKVLDREVQRSTKRISTSKGAGSYYTRPWRMAGVPTLARFLREHPIGSYIVRTECRGFGHFSNVYDGEVIQCNYFMPGRRHRVTHFIDVERETVEEVS